MKGLQLLLTPLGEGTGEDFLNREGFPEPHPVRLTENGRVEESPGASDHEPAVSPLPHGTQGDVSPEAPARQPQCRP